MNFTNNMSGRFARVMKLTFLFLLVLTLQVNAVARAQQINLHETNVSMETVLNKIKAQSGYKFLFNNQMIADAGPVTVNVNGVTLAQALNACFRNQPLTYELINNTVVLKRKTIVQKTITGRVTDVAGQALPGASVYAEKDKKRVVTTDQNGAFTLQAAAGDQLIVRMIGFQQYSVLITEQSNYQVILRESSEQLNEVVVTALGIKREQRALGYSVSTLRTEDLTNAVSNNWTNALTGKVAGLNLIKSGGGPAGSNKIILRGENALGGNSEALIVIDGMITSSSSGRSSQMGTGSNAYLSADSPADFGNSLADINPDDIESVSVLKGPAATALYGSRGQNGAVIITTKSGKLNRGLGVSVNSNTSIETISRWPDYQYEYGQGDAGQDLYYSYLATADGASTRSTSSAWGPKFDGQSYYQYDPITRTTSAERLPWVAYPDNHKDFFQTGLTFLNSVALDGGNEKTSARLSVTNLKNEWIIPNTGYTRNTVSLSLNHKVNDKLQIASKINYTNKYSDNLPSTGYNNQSIMYFIRGLTPNMNIDWFKDYWLPGQEGLAQNRPFSSLLDNPYLIANEMLNKSNRNNVVGNVSATYNFLKNLSLMVRTSMDLSYEARSQQRPFNTNKYVNGMYRTNNIFSQEINSDFLLRYNDEFLDKFDFTITAGGSQTQNRFQRDETRADQLLYPDVFTFANSKNALIALPFKSSFALNSLYTLGSLSYDRFLYMDVSMRNDWSSSLASPVSTDNASFFYPSVSFSAILSEKIKLPDYISYLKIRASAASVGGGTEPYRTAYAYNATQFPGSLANPNVIPNDDLKPLRTNAVELGMEVKMFKDRLSFDVAVYNNSTFNQIFISPIDKSTGYNSMVVNAGEVVNRGVEIAVNGTPIKTKSGLNMNFYGTFSANKNKVVALTDSASSLILGTGPRGTIEARVGGGMGDIYGLGYLRSPEGKIVYSGGYPVLDQTTKYLGNSTARFKASMGTNITYKHFNLNLLFDAQFGAKAYSLTNAVLSEEGKLKTTLPGRYNGIIGDGVVLNADGSYSPNTVVAPNIAAYYKAHFVRDNVESNVFSTDFIKFREARLDYSFGPKLVKRLGLQRATIGAYGRDLFMFTKWPAFDPEFGTLGADGEISAGFESAQFPSTRTFGLNITIGI